MVFVLIFTNYSVSLFGIQKNKKNNLANYQ